MRAKFGQVRRSGKALQVQDGVWEPCATQMGAGAYTGCGLIEKYDDASGKWPLSVVAAPILRSSW